jgi:drug/metabolite transporter (DMT)-like permease
MALILAFLSVALMAVSQLTFKAASLQCDTGTRSKSGIIGMVIQPRVVFALALNGLAAVLWLLALSRLDLSYAAPLLCLNYFVVPFGAYLFFKERISRRRLLAILVICAGVLICLSSRG